MSAVFASAAGPGSGPPSRLPVAVAHLRPDDIAAAVRDLPALPGVVLELMATLREPDANLARIAELIAADQSLAGRVLRLANAPLYGLPRKVTRIHEALALVGVTEIRSLVLAASLPGHFSFPRDSGFSFERYWRHCLATAFAARALAGLSALPEDEAFLAGLLHDIGVLVLATSFPAHYASVLARSQPDLADPREVEGEVLGTDHAVVGGLLVERWRLPDELVAAVAGHHGHNRTLSPGLAGVVQAANSLVHGLEHPGVTAAREAALEACAALGVGETAFDAVLQATSDQVAELYVALVLD